MAGATGKAEPGPALRVVLYLQNLSSSSLPAHPGDRQSSSVSVSPILYRHVVQGFCHWFSGPRVDDRGHSESVGPCVRAALLFPPHWDILHSPKDLQGRSFTGASTYLSWRLHLQRSCWGNGLIHPPSLARLAQAAPWASGTHAQTSRSCQPPPTPPGDSGSFCGNPQCLGKLRKTLLVPCSARDLGWRMSSGVGAAQQSGTCRSSARNRPATTDSQFSRGSGAPSLLLQRNGDFSGSRSV